MARNVAGLPEQAWFSSLASERRFKAVKQRFQFPNPERSAFSATGQRVTSRIAVLVAALVRGAKSVSWGH
jgi:hypothetical protein